DLPGPIQVFSHPGRRPLARGLSLCRAQRVAGEPRAASTKVALVKFVAPGTSNASAVAERLADADSGEMDGLCQSSRERSRTPRLAALRVGGGRDGDPLWEKRTATALALESALRERGRPRKEIGPLKN